MLLLIGFAFLAGIVTILSPCILPVLPVVLASSTSGGKARPWGVVTGFVLSFTLFTLSLSALVQALHLDPDLLRWIAAGLVIVFGLVLVIPRLKDGFLMLATRLSTRFNKPSTAVPGKAPGGYWSGLLLGASLGLVWTPCVGPIMASVISLALSNSIDAGSVVITLAYSLGTAIPLFIILQGGRAILTKFPFFTRNSGRIQQIFGALMLVTGLLIITGVDRKIQQGLLSAFPSYGSGLTAIEENKAVKDAIEKRQGVTATTTADPLTLGSGAWINSAPLTLEGLKGKVVLVDFWTYSCINCLRTMPYLKAWQERYASQGLVIVGVHSPEFAFEQSESNVRKAINDLGITWPVVQDNGFGIWKAYSNQYWPAHYLYDRNGVLVDTHFGEGKYQETEELIRKLLNISGQANPITENKLNPANQALSPETYLGYARAQNYMGTHAIIQDENAVYQLPSALSPDEWALEGMWKITSEYSTNQGKASLSYHFSAHDVYLVLSPASQNSGQIKVSVDGKPSDTTDVHNGILKLDGERLYHLFSSTEQRTATIRIEFVEPIKAYAFTFG